MKREMDEMERSAVVVRVYVAVQMLCSVRERLYVPAEQQLRVQYCSAEPKAQRREMVKLLYVLVCCCCCRSFFSRSLQYWY